MMTWSLLVIVVVALIGVGLLVAVVAALAAGGRRSERAQPGIGAVVAMVVVAAMMMLCLCGGGFGVYSYQRMAFEARTQAERDLQRAMEAERRAVLEQRRIEADMQLDDQAEQSAEALPDGQ